MSEKNLPVKSIKIECGICGDLVKEKKLFKNKSKKCECKFDVCIDCNDSHESISRKNRKAPLSCFVCRTVNQDSFIIKCSGYGCPGHHPNELLSQDEVVPGAFVQFLETFVAFIS